MLLSYRREMGVREWGGMASNSAMLADIIIRWPKGIIPFAISGKKIQHVSMSEKKNRERGSDVDRDLRETHGSGSFFEETKEQERSFG